MRIANCFSLEPPTRIMFPADDVVGKYADAEAVKSVQALRALGYRYDDCVMIDEPEIAGGFKPRKEPMIIFEPITAEDFIDRCITSGISPTRFDAELLWREILANAEEAIENDKDDGEEEYEE